MKITSRPPGDPLEEGQRAMLVVHSLLEDAYEFRAQTGTVKLLLEIVDGRMTTVITYLDEHGDLIVQRCIEETEDFL